MVGDEFNWEISSFAYSFSLFMCVGVWVCICVCVHIGAVVDWPPSLYEI
jgi:hypothetical protein